MSNHKARLGLRFQLVLRSRLIFLPLVLFFPTLLPASKGSVVQAIQQQEKLPFSVDAAHDFAPISQEKPEGSGTFFSINYVNGSRSIVIIFDAAQLYRSVHFDDVAFKKFAEEAVKRQFRFPVKIVSRKSSKLGTLSALEFQSNAESAIDQPITRLHAFFAQGHCFIYSATIAQTAFATESELEAARTMLLTWKPKTEPASALAQCHKALSEKK
jgi:hypothetical protein